jgi:hypothetical protein
MGDPSVLAAGSGDGGSCHQVAAPVPLHADRGMAELTLPLIEADPADGRRPPVKGRSLVEKKGTLWPRSDATHLATQHVEQLRQVIDAGIPEKPTDAGIFFPHCAPRNPPGVISLMRRRAELHGEKATTARGEALPPMENGPAGPALYGDGHQ